MLKVHCGDLLRTLVLVFVDTVDDRSKEALNRISRSNSNANLSVNEQEVLLDLGVKTVGIRNVKPPTKFGTQESNQISQKSIQHIQFVGKEFEDSVVRSSINMFGNPHKQT